MKRILALIIVIICLCTFVVWHDHAGAPGHTTKDSRTSGTTNSSSQSGFDKTRYSTTDPSSIWVIVNKQHPLNPKDYAPADLVAVGNGQYMRAEAASALKQMLADAANAGYTVIPASGYRSYETQVSVYNSEVTSYGQTVADSESARPGYSEHQTGWAIDLGSGGCNITDCFGDTPGGKWVTANAYKYGFILRYTAANTSITGYRAEAWHFRYVGKDLSEEMHKEGVTTLEQFFGVSGGTTYKD
jgi:D-alanyl-D-alanine carboxypeptidase